MDFIFLAKVYEQNVEIFSYSGREIVYEQNVEIFSYSGREIVFRREKHFPP